MAGGRGSGGRGRPAVAQSRCSRRGSGSPRTRATSRTIRFARRPGSGPTTPAGTGAAWSSRAVRSSSASSRPRSASPARAAMLVRARRSSREQPTAERRGSQCPGRAAGRTRPSTSCRPASLSRPRPTTSTPSGREASSGEAPTADAPGGSCAASRVGGSSSSTSRTRGTGSSSRPSRTSTGASSTSACEAPGTAAARGAPARSRTRSSTRTGRRRRTGRSCRGRSWARGTPGPETTAPASSGGPTTARGLGASAPTPRRWSRRSPRSAHAARST